MDNGTTDGGANAFLAASYKCNESKQFVTLFHVIKIGGTVVLNVLQWPC